MRRSDWLEALTRRENAFTAGERLWRCSEQWIQALAELAQDPSVILAELPLWARLLDRHSSVTVRREGEGCELLWSNVPGFPPDAFECEFRLGALRSLFACCAGDEVVAVAHLECAARGGDRCRYEVLDWIPVRDRRHERMLREASLLAADLEGRESERRRLWEMAVRTGPLPDVRELHGVRRFLEELEDIILVLDRDLYVLDANQAALRFAGMSLSELQGSSAADLLTDESLASVRGMLPRLYEMSALRGIQLEIRTRRGPATIEVSARVAASGESIVCVARDITGRLALERELARRNEQLRAQNERIADADRLKSEFLANVSHELTTPLTSIKGFAKLLRADVAAEFAGGARLGAEQRVEFLGLVEREVVRMSEMIHGLLELSNLEAGGVALTRKSVALDAIVDECLQILKPRLDEAGLELEVVARSRPAARPARPRPHQAGRAQPARERHQVQRARRADRRADPARARAKRRLRSSCASPTRARSSQPGRPRADLRALRPARRFVLAQVRRRRPGPQRGARDRRAARRKGLGGASRARTRGVHRAVAGR